MPALSREQLDYIHRSIKDPRFVPIIKEYERMKKEEKITRPLWYRLFKGPSSLQQLAQKVKMERFYITDYRDWSAIAHAGNSSRYIETLPNGTLVGHQLRCPENLIQYSYLAGFFIWAATDSMLSKFRPPEPNHAKWSADIRKTLEELSKTEVVVKRVRL